MTERPAEAALFAAIDATWPALRVIERGGWRVREGAGGGGRVSSATTEDEEAGIAAMEAAQAGLGQAPLVRLRGGQARLDARLAEAGYAVMDPTDIYAAPVGRIARDLPAERVVALAFPPLAIQREIWAGGGIGPARQAVMARAAGPKAALLGRAEGQPAGAAFVAIHGEIAMLHALEVRPEMRRQKTARNIMWGAANWAQDRGARFMAVLVTRRNDAANALYRSIEMDLAGHYLYRAGQARQEAGAGS